MTLTEVADYFRMLVDEPDRTFLPDKQVSMLMKNAYSQWNHLVRDNDDSLDDYFLPIQNPGQVVNLYTGPNNLVAQPPFAGLNVNGTSGGVRLMRINAVTDLNFNGGSGISTAYSPGKPSVYYGESTVSGSEVTSVTVNTTTILSSSYSSSAAFETAAFNLVTSNGGTITGLGEGGIITGPFGPFSISVTSNPSGSIVLNQFQTGVSPTGTPNGSTPSIWTITIDGNNPPSPGFSVTINGNTTTLDSNAYTFLSSIFTNINNAGGYGGLSTVGQNLVITITSAYGANNGMTVAISNVSPAGSAVLTQTQVGSGVNGGFSPTASGANFAINKVYKAAASITELANNSELRYFYQNGSLWFNYQPQNGIVIWYAGIPQYDFTKIGFSDSVQWDLQLEPYHDILALLMGKIYTIKDVTMNAALDQQLQMRVTQLKEHLSTGIDFKAHQYVHSVNRVGSGYRY